MPVLERSFQGYEEAGDALEEVVYARRYSEEMTGTSYLMTSIEDDDAELRRLTECDPVGRLKVVTPERKPCPYTLGRAIEEWCKLVRADVD
ncbi:hypothetical protein EW146_g7667 [Bondarzewia mesenterica]|uniref:Uncharacterized protein n=1 Tax=Bondarzewia mesenterica TaxID=1095465 RepID=A0A4S4LKQ7_9AGAM|nr:hypothetical protein EW146_g7667 [Bondarzewia mesenterica]